MVGDLAGCDRVTAGRCHKNTGKDDIQGNKIKNIDIELRY